jgi:hypothetical protein
MERRHVDAALNGFVQDVQHLYGDDLVAVFLYGSATTGEHVPGRSDINVAVVLSRLTPTLLRKVSGRLRAWTRQGFATPVFFDPEFLRGGADAFPIEFLDMQAHHRLLWGPDILGDLRIDTAPLRRQCEYELRRTLVRLRQAYVESAHSPKELEAVLASAASGLVVLARTLLHLAHADAGGGTVAILDRVAATFGVTTGHLRQAWQLKRGEIRMSGSELEILYRAVLDEFQRLVQVVDAFPA